ncbi:MAG: hypothetical protein AB1Z98_35450 [Nannocystaceae bacterium]
MSSREAWVDEVVVAMERRIAGAQAQPDFLDVVTRARELDPEAFGPETLELAEELEQGYASADELGDDDERAVLDAWIEDVRGGVERRVQQRRQQPIPALPVRSRRRGAWWVAGAVAASLLLALGVSRLVGTSVTPRAVALDQALRLSEPGGTSGGMATPRGGSPARSGRSARVAPSEPDVAPLPSVQLVESEGESTVESGPEPAGRRAGPTRADELARLAEQAQAQWRAGHRDEAVRLFSRIVDRGGRGRAAEMAYGDLFTLAYQQRDATAQRRWWRSYLRRFPRGRFADDARAGLCRTGAEGRRAECWAAYLEDLPHGSYRAEATAAVEASSP